MKNNQLVISSIWQIKRPIPRKPEAAASKQGRDQGKQLHRVLLKQQLPHRHADLAKVSAFQLPNRYADLAKVSTCQRSQKLFLHYRSTSVSSVTFRPGDGQSSILYQFSIVYHSCSIVWLDVRVSFQLGSARLVSIQPFSSGQSRWV